MKAAHKTDDRERNTSGLTALCVVCSAMLGLVLLVLFLPQLNDLVFAAIATVDTEYAPKYTSQAFNEIEIGDQLETVLDRLGEPYIKHDIALPEALKYDDLDVSVVVGAEGKVLSIEDPNQILASKGCEKLSTSSQLREVLGSATSYERANNMVIWFYSRSKAHGSYWQRSITFDMDTRTVLRKNKSLYID